MGLYKSSNPTADFVIEVLKTLDQDELQRVAEFLLTRLNEKPIIDIPTDSHPVPIKPVQEVPVQVNQMLQTLLGGNTDLLNKNSLGSLLSMLGGNKKISSLIKTGDDDDDDYRDDKTSSLLASPFDSLLNSFLPKLLEFGNEVMNPKKISREEQLVEALVQFAPIRAQSSIRSFQPAIRIFSLLQQEGVFPINLRKLGNIFKLKK